MGSFPLFAFRFSLEFPRRHCDHTRDSSLLPAQAVRLGDPYARARKKQAAAKVEMPHAGPSGIATGEALRGSDPLKAPI